MVVRMPQLLEYIKMDIFYTIYFILKLKTTVLVRLIYSLMFFKINTFLYKNKYLNKLI